MAMQAGIIFDLDGTLVDNMQAHVDTWMALIADWQLSWTREAFHQQLTGCDNLHIVRTLLGEHITEAEALAIGGRKEAAYRERYRPVLRPGARALLERAAAAKVPCAIASSAIPENIEYVIAETGIRPLLQAVVSATQVAAAKPAPDVFLQAAADMQLHPGHCLVCEDSRVGLQAAAAAGMPCWLIGDFCTAAALAQQPGVLGASKDFQPLIGAGRPMAWWIANS